MATVASPIDALRRLSARARARWLAVRDVLAVVLASSAAVAVVLIADRWSREYYRNVVDDSLISLVYAKNLATGHGLVFNPGEKVEGYTNFLWTVLNAPTYWLSSAVGWDFVTSAVRLNLFISGANALLLYAIGRKLWQGRLLPLLAAVTLLVVDNSYTVWAAMALEKQLVSLCMLGAIALWLSEHHRRGVLTGLALAAMVMARPDSALFVPCFFLSLLLHQGWRRFRGGAAEAREPFRQLLWAGGALSLVYGVYFAWRYGYYGYPLPNTYYLKVGSSQFEAVERGKRYLIEFLQERENLALVPLLSVLWIGNPIVRAVLLWVVVHALYVVKVGGDFYPGHRFYVVLIPALGLLLGHVVYGLSDAARWLGDRTRRLRFLPVVTNLALLAGIVALGTRWLQLGLTRGPIKTEVRAWGKFVDDNKRFMQWLGTRVEPGDALLIGDIGSGGMYTNARIIDYYGVIDPEIAHQDVPSLGRGKAGHEKMASFQYVMDQKPRFMKWGYLHGDFWQHGYYFDTLIPHGMNQPGLWVRDELLETGRYLDATRIGFEPGDYPGWAAIGDAFQRWPTIGTPSNQLPVTGAKGYYLSSFSPELGDRATGRLISAPFSLIGDKLVMRVAGGRHPDKLRVSLLVDGQRVGNATGNDVEHFGRRVMDIAPYRGKAGVLEVVDDEPGSWGHIMVDEVVQWAAGR